MRDKEDSERGRILTFNKRFDSARQNITQKPAEQLQESLVIESSDISTDSENEGEPVVGAVGGTPTVIDEYRLIHQDHFHVARSRGRSRGRGGRGGRGRSRGRGGTKETKDSKNLG